MDLITNYINSKATEFVDAHYDTYRKDLLFKNETFRNYMKDPDTFKGFLESEVYINQSDLIKIFNINKEGRTSSSIEDELKSLIQKPLYNRIKSEFLSELNDDLRNLETELNSLKLDIDLLNDEGELDHAKTIEQNRNIKNLDVIQKQVALIKLEIENF